ncbi:MAG: hypothetical protein JST54_18795 [Deltaproteobacteria bacterium]|nr:hypothetical protein [Deltaproteobacteria bacterium]
MWRAWVLPALLCAGCASATSVRFPQDIAASFAKQPMRYLETPELELYYPADAQSDAMRIAGRLTHCLETLRQLPLSQTPRPRLLLYLTSANFNNAYVQPMFLGNPQQMVVPLHETDELFNLLIAPGAEIGDVTCHEAVHYVQLQQVEGLWWWVNHFGGEILSPNIFTESWFLEGLAVHYEGRLDKDVGRPWNPIWRGLFPSGVASRGGKLNPGYLQPDQRDTTPFGGNYLVGEQFVDYLATTYGEQKLWELVDREANSPAPQLAVAVQFMRVYGKTLGGLFKEFSEHLEKEGLQRPRPPNQRVLVDDLGFYARMTAAPDGTLAVIFAPRDRPVELGLYGPDDHEIYRVSLAPLLPERPFITTSPTAISGLCFSSDGKRLYFVVQDVALDGDDESKLVELDAASGEPLRTWRWLEGMGGGLMPDGKSYVFTHLEKDVANLVAIDLESGKRRALTFFTTHQSLGVSAISPSGKRIVFPKWMGQGFDLFVLEDGVERAVTHDQHFNQSPRFLDEDHVVLLRDVDGRAQASIVDLASGAVSQATDAPFTAFDPAPRPGGRLAFVNRDAWSWTLDEVPLDAQTPATIPEPVPPANLEAASSEVQVVRDEPYHATDHLLAPTYHLPLVVLGSASPTSITAGIEVAGSDRLGFHNYDLQASYGYPGGLISFAGDYVNMQLAPWQLGISASRLEDSEHTIEYDLDLGISRTFWTTPVTLDVPFIRRESAGFTGDLVGPRLTVLLAPVTGSVYGGTQRGFSLNLSGQGFPRGLGNDFDFADVRSALRIWLPQPIPRASLSVLGVARALPGAPETLLTVGGLQPAGLIFQSSNTGADGLQGVILPTQVSFNEPLRGYEDFTLHGNAVLIGGADFHVPLVIDYGWASFFYILPSFFVREVDLDAFGRLAQLDGPVPGTHRVVGAQLSLQTRIGSLYAPVLYVQFANRFDDGLGPLTFFGLSL